MKVAFVTIYDPSNINYSSGTPYHIFKMLKESGFQVESIQTAVKRNYSGQRSLLRRLRDAYNDKTLSDKIKYRLKSAYYEKLLAKTYFREHDPNDLLRYASNAERQLAATDYDIAFVWSYQSAAYLNINKPLVFWYDSTFAGIVDVFPPLENICNESRRHGHRADKLALSKSHLAIYSSAWAAKTAIDNYNIEPEKVKTVPFGANINCDRSLQDIKVITKNKQFDICKLFFLGTRWHIKDGDKAVTVADLLNQRGLKTELHIAGSSPPGDLPHFVKAHGFISKNTKQGIKLLDKLFSESHFFILPSIYESFGIVFAEASSFGLPSLATRVGGVTTAVKDGINGQTFAPDDDADKYCDFIEKLMSDREAYTSLALSSFDEYATRLNWSVAGEKIYKHIMDFCL